MTHPGPTHPGPSGPTSPSPRGGHLPIGGYALPNLGQIIRDAERLGAQMLAVLKRDFDPASGPSDDDLHGPGYVTVRRMCAVADVNSALRMLAEITDLDLPAVGSAVTYPARQDHPVATAGGPSDHPDSAVQGERRSPGYDTAAATAVSGSPAGRGGPNGQAASSPVQSPGWPTSGPRPAVAPVAAGGSPGGFATPGAGVHDPERPTSPGLPPRPGVLSGAAPIGAPFTLPGAKPWWS